MGFWCGVERGGDVPFCGRVVREGASASRSSSSRCRGVSASAPRTRYRFGRDKRIAQSAGYGRLLEHGARHRMSGYTFFIERREAGPPRLGIMVSRKHAKRATIRNDLKRCIREAFRLEQHRLGAIDLVVRPPLGAVPCSRLIDDLRAMLVRLSR